MLPHCMKWSFVFFVPLAFMSSACERHSASSLPSHGGHASEHAAPAAVHAPPAVSQPVDSSKAAPASAPKFFDQQPK